MKNFFRMMAILFIFVWMTVAWAKELPLAPDFKLPDTNDRIVTLSGYRQQQPILLFFWTTWCPFCQKELRVLNNAYGELAKNNLKVLAIDAGESRKAVANYLRGLGFMFDVLLDEDGKVADSFEVLGVPTYILINRKGEIIFEGNSFPKNYQELILKSENPE